MNHNIDNNLPPLICGADRYECQTLEEMQQHMAREHGVDNNQALDNVLDIGGAKPYEQIKADIQAWHNTEVATILNRLLEQKHDYEVTDLELLEHHDETPLVAVPVEAITAELNKAKGTKV